MTSRSNRNTPMGVFAFHEPTQTGTNLKFKLVRTATSENFQKEIDIYLKTQRIRRYPMFRSSMEDPDEKTTANTEAEKFGLPVKIRG